MILTSLMAAVMLSVLALCVFIVGSSHGLASAKEYQDLGLETRIIGGQPAVQGEFPSQVAIYNTDGFVCGGSILNTEWVLTAALFIYPLDIDTLYVRSGTINLSSPSAPIHDVVTMVFYTGILITPLDSDIGVMKVFPPFELDGFRWKAITLPAPGVIPAESTVATIIGWGYRQDSGPPADFLQKANVVVANREACRKYLNTLRGTQICTDVPSGGLGPCHRDQGGPMFVDGEVVALVSGGEACDPVAYKYAVYTLVSPYVEWIKHHANDAPMMPCSRAHVIAVLCFVLRSMLT